MPPQLTKFGFGGLIQDLRLRPQKQPTTFPGNTIDVVAIFPEQVSSLAILWRDQISKIRRKNANRCRHRANYALNGNSILAKQKAAYHSGYKEKVLARNRIYQSKNRDKMRLISNRYYHANKEAFLRKCREWVAANPEKVREAARNYARRIRATAKGALDHRMSVAMQLCLKANKSRRSWKSFVPYSFEDLKIRIESQFTPGMSWDVLVSGRIHIDHIIPKSKFSYTSPNDPEFQKCWALENLQPLWAVDNLRKGDKTPWLI